MFALRKLSRIERVIEITQITYALCFNDSVPAIILMGMIEQLFSLRQFFSKETVDLLTYGLLIYSYRSRNDSVP